MDLVSSARVLTRHWLLSTVALLIAATVVVGLYIKVPTTYSGNAMLLLLPPASGGTFQPLPSTTAKPVPPKVVNPYLSFDSSLWVLAKVMAQDLTTDQTKARLAGYGETARYEVTAQSDEPAIMVVVTDPDRDRILAMLSDIMTMAKSDLTQRQQATGVPRDTWVSSTTSAIPIKMDKTKDKPKLIVAAGAVAVGLAISLVFIVESTQAGARGRRVTRRRRAHRRVEQPNGLGEEVPAAEEAGERITVPQYRTE